MKQGNSLKTALSAICVAGVLAAATPVSAITYNLNDEFSGAQDPVGVPPWVVISLVDAGPGAVSLSIANTGLTATEFNSATFLNVADAFRGLLNVSLSGSVGSFTAPTVFQQTGAQDSDSGTFKADGDGFFDLAFAFGSGAGAFGAGETATFSITATGLSANSFGLQSFTGGGNGIWYAAAHIQSIGINGEGSGWIGADTTTDVPGVPDGGSTVALLGFALIGVDALRRKMRRA
jgi:hypothetical protein